MCQIRQNLIDSPEELNSLLSPKNGTLEEGRHYIVLGEMEKGTHFGHQSFFPHSFQVNQILKVVVPLRVLVLTKIAITSETSKLPEKVRHTLLEHLEKESNSRFS